VYEDVASFPFGPTARLASENDQDCAEIATVAIENTNTNAWMNFAILFLNAGRGRFANFGDRLIDVAENHQFPVKPEQFITNISAFPKKSNSDSRG